MATMSPLRRRMIEDMTIRNLSPATQQSYLYAVAKFSRHFGVPPAQLGTEQVRAYQLHLIAQKRSWSHINQVACALRFFYGVTLGQRDAVARHLLVDTQGLLMHAIVHAAHVQDRDGGVWLMAVLFARYPFLVKLYAEGGYQGPQFRRAIKKILRRVNLEIVKRSDQAKGFVVLPKRWIVERTIAWLNRCRRLAKDWENLNCKALAFLRLASIRLMLRRLCNPA